jgi:hypothetical protein
VIEAIEISDFHAHRNRMAFENRMYGKSLQETTLHWHGAEL